MPAEASEITLLAGRPVGEKGEGVCQDESFDEGDSETEGNADSPSDAATGAPVATTWTPSHKMLQVVIPMTERELPLLLKNVELAYKFRNRKVPNPTILACETGMNQEIVDIAYKCLKKVFWKAELFRYHKGPSGWPAGPNHAFKMCAWHVADQRVDVRTSTQQYWDRKNGVTKGKRLPLPPDLKQQVEERMAQPWLWWEMDAVPLQAHWLTTLYDAYLASGKPLAGHVVGSMEHMNGVGIYPGDFRQYSIRAFTSIKTPWDVAMKAETRHYTANLNHLILHYWNIKDGKNFNGPEGVPLSVQTYDELKQWITPEAVLLHRCKDGSVAEVLIKECDKANAQKLEILRKEDPKKAKRYRPIYPIPAPPREHGADGVAETGRPGDGVPADDGQSGGAAGDGSADERIAVQLPEPEPERGTDAGPDRGVQHVPQQPDGHGGTPAGRRGGRGNIRRGKQRTVTTP